MNPSGAAAHDPGSRAQGQRDAALMSIGEVLAQLRTEFPDTTISKLRFLEAEGLVDPQRTASGYRKYSWNDVARLRFVLTAQRDQYLPLRVIREQLEALERGDDPLSHQRPTLVAVGSEAEVAADSADTRVSAASAATSVSEPTATSDGRCRVSGSSPRSSASSCSRMTRNGRYWSRWAVSTNRSRATSFHEYFR